ncbi:MAG: hypothetical protein F4Z87_07235 [Gammaproteobacteria bacterium]|nr:hypothetical protein [Gammaproteobacteria bacterium]
MRSVRDILSDRDPNDVPCRGERYTDIKAIHDRVKEWLDALDDREKGPSLIETKTFLIEIDKMTEGLRKWEFGSTDVRR